MLDSERILAKIDELDGYLSELGEVAPASLAEYERIEKRRSCERLLQISIESVVDVCGLIVAGLRLGLPGEEDDLLAKLVGAGVITHGMAEVLHSMKGLRNLLVHEYGRVDDRIVYAAVRTRLGDFAEFKRVILEFLRQTP
ncbi:MAG: DUF86 domain-containing protein [Actinomycetota bacterium]